MKPPARNQARGSKPSPFAKEFRGDAEWAEKCSDLSSAPGGPKERDAFGRNRAEQDACAIPVLVEAFHKLAGGWCRPYLPSDIGNGAAPEGIGLIEAVQTSGPDPQGVECWYARRVLQRLEFSLQRWEAHPHRTHADVLRLVQKAVVLAGGACPSWPSPRPVLNRGGWTVGQ